MKIGLLGSGIDILSLFTFLHRYDVEFVVWNDDVSGSWGDKPSSFVQERVDIGVAFLQQQGVEVILVSPLVELLLLGGKMGGEIGSKIYSKELGGIALLPLYTTYLQYALSHSLVGKIGFVGDWLDVKEGQPLLEHLSSSFVLTEAQAATKKFHVPFAWWKKEVRNWKYLLDSMSWSHPLMNRLVKQDLRYFKDADVDTLLPLNYSYFLLEKVILKAGHFARMRFHGSVVLEKVFVSLVDAIENKASSAYSVKVFCTGHGEFLTTSKKLMWLLGRGATDLVEVKPFS